MSKSPSPPSSKKKNLLEWAVFGLSAALLIGVIAVLVHQSLTVGEKPAHLTIRMGTPLVSSEQVRVPLSVTNDGDEPAIGVEIEIQGTLEGSTLSSTLQFEYVPHHSRREGWVSFPGPEVPENLSSRVLGYTDP